MTRRTKRKALAHIIEKKSLAIIEAILPVFWTIREYKPDYGIDIILELFEEKPGKTKPVYDTLGEHIYIQVKGAENLKPSKIKVHLRNNVENGPLQESEKFKEIEVFKFSIDTVELNTVQRMGSAFPVLLFLVETNTGRVFFVCLNDYIDKILLPEATEYSGKKTKTIFIPAVNEITNDKDSLLPLYLYAKRPKYHAFFSKVAYQYRELYYCDGYELTERAKHFAKLLLYNDVWDQRYNWATLSEYYKELQNVAEFGCTIDFSKTGDSLDNIEKAWDRNGDENYVYTEFEMRRSMAISSLWHQLSTINNVFESMSREWFLPTFMFS
ncbi:DUF4365 domain-containing protein [Flavobacterium pallidum]|uniref:DUF4365 domain-containing protein n=1 Tax=Flavobacterium pallidum TaxID=2172098 RepID=A0A2S1SKG8_9FLAO|nr:DUF4365 domain-containing protein [Flavobacterium pallidum]AWI26846.1 hypothetical protein HYN49_13575 [Flavobacterium pallidum]